MFVKKVLMIVLVSVIYLINLNIPVAAEENEQDIIFSPNWMLENGAFGLVEQYTYTRQIKKYYHLLQELM